MLLSLSSLVVVVLVIFLTTCPQVTAWGREGHEIVANIAYNILTEATKDASYRVLFPSDDFNATDDHTSPLAAVANWADKVRFTKYFAWTTPLHYVDVKDGDITGGCPIIPQKKLAQFNATRTGTSNCTFVYERDCKKGACAVGAIVEFSHQSRDPNEMNGQNMIFKSQIPEWKMQRGLRSPDIPDRMSNITQRQSLMFLIHIIGDIHQPLHASRESDRGGNTIHVSFPEEFPGFRDERYGHAHKGWNLHSVWDSAIIQRAIRLHHNSSQYEFQSYIEDSLLTEDNINSWRACPPRSSIGSKICTAQWAEESFEDALEYAYGDENGKEVKNGTILTEAYFETRLEIVQKHLAAGAVRLAASLEDIYGSHLQKQSIL